MAIQQHPLPQDISSYRFRLIGDMTIKQFASLGISIVLAIFAYSLPLPFFFKYPLSFLFVVLGIGMAFVPVQGRSLDVWIIAFIKSIYSPTLFAWKKTPESEITADTAAPHGVNLASHVPTVSNATIEIPHQTAVTAATPATTSPTPETPTPPTEKTIPSPANQPTLPTPNSVTPPTSSLVTGPSTPEINIQAVTPSPKPEPITNAAQPSIDTTTSPAGVVTAPDQPKISPQTNIAPSQTPPPSATHLPIPFTPTTPNTLVGLTITKDNRIIDSVLIEIKKNNITTRATKSNKLGQFMFARPLENGLYQIIAEKDGFTFATYSLELTGEIVRPLKIQAQ